MPLGVARLSVVSYSKKQQYVDYYLHLIARHLAGEMEQEEQQALQTWLHASPENRRLFEQLSEVWHKGRYEPTIRGQEQVFNRIASQLGLEYEKPVPAVTTRISLFWQQWRRIAAALLLVAGATLWFLWHAQQRQNILPESEQITTVSKRTPHGQKSLVRLPDGSTVKLNAGSYLEYTSDFLQNRQLTMEGEAFFDIVRDTLRPFVVHAGAVQVRVLGTSFNVKAFPAEENLTVAVASGAVLVEEKYGTDTTHSRQLRPLEMVSVNQRTGSMEKDTFEPDDLLAWKEGILVFQQDSFEEIIRKLERWYGVKFVIRRQQPVTGGFTGRYHNPSLRLVLEGMSFSSDFSYTLKKDTVIIE